MNTTRFPAARRSPQAAPRNNQPSASRPSRFLSILSAQSDTKPCWACCLVMLLAAFTLAPAVEQTTGGGDNSLPSIPDYFQDGGVTHTKGYENQAVNEVIDTFSGKLQYHFTDIFIPGNGGLDLAVQRSYNSIDDPTQTVPVDYDPQRTRSPVGLGWTMHFGRVLRGANLGICSSNFATSNKNPVLELPDGSRQVLYERSEAAPTVWWTKNFWRASCDTSTGVLGFNVDSPDGTRYKITTQGNVSGPASSPKTLTTPPVSPTATATS